MDKKSSFVIGLVAGLPICLGYLSVSFAFGVEAVRQGFTVWDALLISALNVTSAGQVAAVPLIARGGSLIELAFTELIINLRYALMSLTLSQKFDRSVRLRDRFTLAFLNTDEVFVVSSAQAGRVGRSFMQGLELLPFIGWTGGTFLGALAGSVLPPLLTSALGVAIYGMFVAICTPVARKDERVLFCILLSVALRCLLKYTPVLNQISPGFAIIICAVVASSVLAWADCVHPPKAEKAGRLRH